MMFPTIQFNMDNTKLSPKSLGKVFLFDFDTKQLVLVDGKPVEASYEQAIKQWVTMVLITEQGKYKVYQDLNFGLTLTQFIGRKDIPLATVISEVKRQIEEQLLKHPEITGISNFALVRQDSKAMINFNVQTKQGLIEGIESEVKYSG